MSEAVVETEQDTALVETPATQLPQESIAPASDDLDSLLAEFDSVTNKPAESEPLTADAVQDTSAAELDKLLGDFGIPTADQQKITGLEGQLNDLRNQMRAAEELKAFGEFADNLQKQIPEWLPSDYARVKLESLAHDPVARLAWETRHINAADAARDLAHVQHALNQLKRNTNADPKQVQQLNTLAYQLNVAANSAAILRQARNQIIKEANGLMPPYDPEATADRDAVAFAVRENISGTIPEPPVNFGRMTDKEFKEYTRTHYGF